MNRHPEQPLDPADDAPPGLTDDLRALYRTPPVPPGTDLHVLADARARFAARAGRRNRFRLLLRWGGGAAAAAAVLVLALRFALDSSNSGPAQAPQAAVSPARIEDVDRDGRFDVVDALCLARRIESHEAVEPHYDFNQDGRVTREDAAALARSAVRLGRETVQ